MPKSANPSVSSRALLRNGKASLVLLRAKQAELNREASQAIEALPDFSVRAQHYGRFSHRKSRAGFKFIIGKKGDRILASDYGDDASAASPESFPEYSPEAFDGPATELLALLLDMIPHARAI